MSHFADLIDSHDAIDASGQGIIYANVRTAIAADEWGAFMDHYSRVFSSGAVIQIRGGDEDGELRASPESTQYLPADESDMNKTSKNKPSSLTSAFGLLATSTIKPASMPTINAGNATSTSDASDAKTANDTKAQTSANDKSEAASPSADAAQQHHAERAAKTSSYFNKNLANQQLGGSRQIAIAIDVQHPENSIERVAETHKLLGTACADGQRVQVFFSPLHEEILVYQNGTVLPYSDYGVDGRDDLLDLETSTSSGGL